MTIYFWTLTKTAARQTLGYSLTIILLLFFTSFSFAQTLCDSKSLTELEKQFHKAERKGKSDQFKFAFMAFDIAECYRQNQDTSALQWYQKNIQTAKLVLKGCNQSAETHNLIFQIGVSSYHLAKYKEAESYLHKAIAANTNIDSYFYLAKTLLKLEMWQEAKVQLLNFRAKSSSYPEVEVLLNVCDEKIRGK